jgi:radical SAM protein with 4Fe4S-binding SPASM domain
MGTYSRTGSHRVNGANAFFAEHGYVEVPSLVQWMATLQCGLSCAHCLAVSRESGFSDMPLERVRKLIDEVAAMGVAEFLVTGGEPLARTDLAAVVAYLGHKQINGTLNTAALPDKTLREAISQNKPGFVAVSLDGPRKVHDAFRGKAGAYDEAMEAIRFFKSLDGVRVCAGTTVTMRNYDYLDETFHLAAAGGADQWGIHLLVPEGRAASQPDLFLSKAQLKRLIKFVARKRRYFRVEMADEIGYLGYLEPLVRDRPLTCGAGRSQCVVLPDGAVVPCTTLDRSCSAGNIHEHSLMQIWNEGFADLRAWQPTGKCGHCDYAVACKGGCWLQRKAGQQCFKEVWHVPGVLKTAAGIAICLGTLAAPQAQATASVVTLSGEVPQASVSLKRSRGGDQTPEEEAIPLNEAIMDFYAKQITGYPPISLDRIDPNDVGGQFFMDYRNGILPPDMTERCVMVCNALETQQHSLSFIALLWRAVCEPLFEFDSLTVYSEEERQVIRDTMAALKEKAAAWRLEISENNLEAYLSNNRQTTPECSRSKAGGPSPCVDGTTYLLLKDLNEERWGRRADPESHEAAQAYLLDHHYADHMDLVFRVEPSWKGVLGVYRYSGSEVEFLGPRQGPDDPNRHTVGIFDTLLADESVTLSLEIKGSLRVRDSRDDTEDALLDDRAREDDLTTNVTVGLTPGREYTYVELLNRIHSRHKTGLPCKAKDWLMGSVAHLWGRVNVVAAVHENGALLWPAFREMIETGLVPAHDEDGHPVEAPLYPSELRRALLKDTDFWMF